MVPMEHDTEHDLTLESILEEYRGFDPEAPEDTPLPEAAFLSKVAEAELIDAGPEELLTPEEYEAIRANTMKISERLRKGKYTTRALGKALGEEG